MTQDDKQPFQHDENMQAFEQDGKVLVAIVDETYGKSQDADWERDREKFRLRLEHEFALPFEDGNIGPGADFPVFITLLQTKVSVPLWQVVAAAFFLGKPLKDNFDAWRDIGRKIQSFLQHSVFLNRQGAAALAVEAVIDELGSNPEFLQLQSYRTAQILEPGDLASMERQTQIAEALPTLHLGFIRHIFEIQADGAMFRVSVDGTTTETLRIADYEN
jgi:hypothetical protein